MTNYLENCDIGTKIQIGDKQRRIHYYGNGLVKDNSGCICKKVNSYALNQYFSNLLA